MIRFLLIVLLFFSKNSFAKEIDKIKFHKAESEAEKFLDYILTAQYFQDIADKEPLKNYDDFEESLKALHTKEFMAEFYKLKERDLKKKECEYEIGCFPYDGLYLDCGYLIKDDVDFLYYDEVIKDNEISIYVNTVLKKNKIISKGVLNFIKNIIEKRGYYNKYSLRKIENKWKIDGICCYDYDKNNLSLSINCLYQSPNQSNFGYDK